MEKDPGARDGSMIVPRDEGTGASERAAPEMGRDVHERDVMP